MKNNQAIPFNKENFNQIFSFAFVLMIVISIPSALIADYFKIPLAWFLGPMLATSIASLLGYSIKTPKIILSSTLILLGLYIGNYIDKNLFSQIQDWFFTSLIMLIYIILSILIVSKYLQKFSGYEEKTSIFSAAPGALGPLMILAEDEKKTDLSHVATAHLIRLIIIITVFPFIVYGFYDNSSLEVNQDIIQNQSEIDLIILIFLSIIFIFLFDKFGLPAALLSGTLTASGLLQITEIASYQFSSNIVDYCLLILGASVGCRFANKTFSEIGKNAFHSLIATILLVILGVIAASVAGLIIDKNFFTLLLSYCPGGIYEVAVIAIFFDLDPEFVSFHHIIRLLMILFVVPIILRFLKKT